MLVHSVYLFSLLALICHVTTNVPPKLEEFKPKKILNVGSKSTMLCSIQDGSLPFRFEWLKNGHILSPIMDNSVHRITTAEGESLLVIDRLSSSDSGNYSCSVTNSFGSDAQSTVLVVKGLPTLGFDSTPTCGAHSLYPGLLSLMFPVNLSLLGDDTFLLVTEYILSVATATMLIYILVFAFLASVYIGPIEANSLLKLEEFKPKRSQNVGSKFTIFCSPQEGVKPFHFEWHKNGHLLQSSSVNPSYRVETSEDGSMLIIEKLIPLDSGNYSCSVKNKHGSDTQFTMLTVKGLVSFLPRYVAHL